jgi:hypothetical protein
MCIDYPVCGGHHFTRRLEFMPIASSMDRLDTPEETLCIVEVFSLASDDILFKDDFVHIKTHGGEHIQNPSL